MLGAGNFELTFNFISEMFVFSIASAAFCYGADTAIQWLEE